MVSLGIGYAALIPRDTTISITTFHCRISIFLFREKQEPGDTEFLTEPAPCEGSFKTYRKVSVLPGLKLDAYGHGYSP